MSDDKYIYAGIASIIAAVITLAGALLSVWVTNRANLRRIKLEQDYQKTKDTKAFLTSKAEELYELTEKWFISLSGYYLNLSFVMQGKITYNDHLDWIIKQNTDEIKFYRIEMIISLYIPHLKNCYEEIIKSRSVLNEIHRRYKKDYEQGYADGSAYLRDYVSAQHHIEKHFEDFKQKIAAFVKSI
jgi:hypothetical protein